MFPYLWKNLYKNSLKLVFHLQSPIVLFYQEINIYGYRLLRLIWLADNVVINSCQRVIRQALEVHQVGRQCCPYFLITDFIFEGKRSEIFTT